MTNAAEYRSNVLAAIDARIAYETEKNAENDSMQNVLKSMRKSVDNDRIAEIMLTYNVDSNRINRQLRNNARYNVKAYQKDINVARCIASVETLNHYSRAIFLAALALEANDMTLTHKDANAACSLDVKTNDTKRDKLINAVKYQAHVAANTTSTQSSSSLNSLQSYNVFTETRDAANNVCFKLNRECEATKSIAAYLNVTL